MKSPKANVAELALRSFVRTFGLFRNHMEPHFARFGISAAQWGVLRTLSRAQAEGLEGLRLGELGHRLLVRPPSVTTIVDRLERMGLLSRSAVAADLRAKHVALTPAGKQMVAQVLEHHPAQIRVVMAGLDEQQQRELHRLTEQLASHLETLNAQSAERPRRTLKGVK